MASPAQRFLTGLVFAVVAAGLLVGLGLAAANVETGRGFPACRSAGGWNGETPTIVDLEFAGDPSRADAIVSCWSPQQRAALRQGVDDDTWFIAAYLVTLAFWCAYGARHFYRAATRRLGWIALAATVVAAGLDLIVENPALRSLLDGHDGAAVRATLGAVPKWVLLLFAAAYAIGAAIIAVVRAVLWIAGVTAMAAFRAQPGFGEPSDAPPEPPRELVEIVESEKDDSYARRYRLPAGVAPSEIAIALSGGGIRSAAFSLGAVQTFDAVAYPGSTATVMASADHIATVSGGGYLGGGRQLLRHDVDDRGGTVAPPAYSVGAPETRYLHENHNFLWDTWREATAGTVRLVSGIGVNVGVLVGLVFVVARPLGWLTFSTLLGQRGPSSAPSGFWWGTTLTVGLVLVLALIGGVAHAALAGGGAFYARAAQVAVVTPAIVGGLLVLVGWRGPDLARGWIPLAAAGAVAVGGLLVGTILTKLGIGSGHRIVTALPIAVLAVTAFALTAFWIDGAAADLDTLRPSIGPVLRFVVVVLATHAAVLLTFSWPPVRPWLHKRTLATQFVLIGIPVAVGLVVAVVMMLAGHWWDVRIDELVLWGAIAGALVALYAFGDQKLWSPHLFYKRRLASAFSGTRTGPGATGAQQLPYNIRTTMSRWGRRTADSPKLLLCCAVHTSNLNIDARRRVWSFTFGDDYVGGPDIGWMRTCDLEAALGRENAGDGTLLAAMAISGAAIASSLGSIGDSGSNAAIAVANARLGVWLPNPRYVRRLRTQRDAGAEPWIRWRRYSYLVKEVLGVYDLDDRFVYVSDGGHLENFGLFELLARRTRVILCCDASGDSYSKSDGAASAIATLRHSLRIARQRLGVGIDFYPPGSTAATPVDVDSAAFSEMVTYLAPSDAAPPGCEDLRGKVCAGAVSAYRIRHDHAPGTPPTLLVVAKASLTPEVCTDPALAPALVAARTHQHFPNDSTIDQWLTEEQFDGYVALGRSVAATAVARLATLLAAGAPDT